MKRVLKSNIKFILLSLMVFMFLMGTVNMEEIKVRVYPLLRGLQHELIIFKTRNFNMKETEHFMIRYENEDKEIIDLISKAVEDKYDEVNKVFNYNPQEKVMVIVYDDPQKLIKNSNLNQSKPPMGVYYTSTIQIINPKYWIEENQDMEYLFLNEGPMVHEYTHYLVDDLTRGNYPLWFTEGLALYQEYLQTGYQWGKDLDYPADPYTVKELTENFNQLDEMLAYKRSFELVKALVEDKGVESLNKLLKKLKDGISFEDAHMVVYSKTVEEIYQGEK